MSNTNSSSNQSFKGMSYGYSQNPPYRNNNIFRNVRILEKTQIDNYLYVKKKYVVGGNVDKDMDNQNFSQEMNPFNYQSVLFPDMASFVDENIILGDKNTEGDRLQASYWRDLGDDIFDSWGYFFIYDVANSKYYFPLLSPQNQDNGVTTTQTFNVFGELSFTITHGWVEKGIFMMNISCTDSNFQFRFGAYGNLGSDGSENDYDMSTTYMTNKTLYYHHHAEIDYEKEILYSYFIPYNDAVDNTSKPYQSLYDPEDTSNNSLITKPITEGIRIYFSKENDVKDWIIADITEVDTTLSNGDIKAEGHIYSESNILASGHNLGRMKLTYLNNDANYIASSSIINGYYVSDGISQTRTFYLPSAQTLYDAIPNSQPGTSFRFTINNYSNIEGGYEWVLSLDASNIQSVNVKNMSIPPGGIITYSIILDLGEGPGGLLVQESEAYPIFT